MGDPVWWDGIRECCERSDEPGRCRDQAEVRASKWKGRTDMNGIAADPHGAPEREQPATPGRTRIRLYGIQRQRVALHRVPSTQRRARQPQPTRDESSWVEFVQERVLLPRARTQEVTANNPLGETVGNDRRRPRNRARSWVKRGTGA